jgi:hypothetical protein
MMALTHELARRGSPVRAFFEERFPAQGFKGLSKAWYETVRERPMVCMPPEGVNPGTLGTAFDYRARICWEPINWATTVAAGGALRTVGLGDTELDVLALELRDELTRIAPVKCGDDLEPAAENRLCRCCYALALYEQFFRTLDARESSPLLGLRGLATVEDLLALAPQSAVDDLATMVRTLCERYPDLVGIHAVLNPTFDGSVEIGGADADLIVDGMLLEFKTTRRDSFERVDHLYQLLGYALLDYSDTYTIRRVAVYMARWGILVRWEIAELLESCGDSANLSRLREDFRKVVVATGEALAPDS